MADEERTIIELDDEDCALVFKANGDMELYLPRHEADAIVSPHAELIAAIAGGMSTNHPAITALVEHQRALVDEQRGKEQS